MNSYVGVQDMVNEGTLPTRQFEWDHYKDPLVAKKRGRSTNKVVVERRCSVCEQVGHTKPRCPNIQQTLDEHTAGGSNSAVPQ